MSKKKTTKEVNLEKIEMLDGIVEREKEQEAVTLEQSLTIAERMMRRAKSKTFTLGFLDEKNDDEIEIEFRLLYTQERRSLMELIDKLQKLQNQDGVDVDVSLFNDALDSLKELVKNVTVTEDMNMYYNSEVCQDGDIFEIARAVMSQTTNTLDDARSFRQE